MKIVLALLLTFSFAQAKVELKAACYSTTKTGDSEGSVGYGSTVIDSERKPVLLFQDFNLDKAFYMLSLAKTGELQGGGEAFRLFLSRTEDEQEVHYSKKPEVKGQMTVNASVQENGGIVSTVWLNRSSKKPNIEDTFPIELKLKYSVKTGFLKKQNIEVICKIDRIGCEGEAQVWTTTILSTEYIDGVGCKAMIKPARIESSTSSACQEVLHDQEIWQNGVIVHPPTAEGCTSKTGDSISGTAEKHGNHVYMYNPTSNAEH